MLPACCTIMPFGHRSSQVTEVIARYLSDFPLGFAQETIATNIALIGLGYFFKQTSGLFSCHVADTNHARFVLWTVPNQANASGQFCLLRG